jgi:hypothetical protein
MGARVSRRRSESTMLVRWSCAIAASLAASTASAQPGEGPPAWRGGLFEYDRLSWLAGELKRAVNDAS